MFVSVLQHIVERFSRRGETEEIQVKCATFQNPPQQIFHFNDVKINLDSVMWLQNVEQQNKIKYRRVNIVEMNALTSLNFWEEPQLEHGNVQKLNTRGKKTTWQPGGETGSASAKPVLRFSGRKSVLLLSVVFPL